MTYVVAEYKKLKCIGLIRVRGSETRAGYRNRQFAVDNVSQPCHIHILRLLCLELTMIGPSGLSEVR